jgi:carbamoyltransferase
MTHPSSHSSTKRNIIGLHHGHDATVVYIHNGEIVEAMSEERLSRQKKHIGFPTRSLEYVKKKYDISSIETVYLVGDKACFDASIFHTEDDNKKMRESEKDKTVSKEYIHSLQFTFPIIHSCLQVYYAIKEQINLPKVAKNVEKYIEKTLPKTRVVRIHHHLAHAWAAVPFMSDKSKTQLIFTLDGAGDGISGSVNLYKDGEVSKIKEMPFDASIGLLYNGIVAMLGMKPNEHEFKVMGLAPYAKKTSGEEVYQKLKKLVWFNHTTMQLESSIPTSRAVSYFIANNYHRFRFDSLAYGIQKLTEECIKEMVLAYCKKYSIYDVAVGGGVFMNVKANQVLLGCKEITSLTITPSCGDESLAIGAAVYGFVHEGNSVHDLLPLKNIYLGSSYTHNEIKEAIESYTFKSSVTVKDLVSEENGVEKEVAKILSEGNVVGRFKGRAEWGARALGNRSILANASNRETIKLINEMIKGRDFWMPFATSLLFEDQHAYLQNERDFFAPYMSITFPTMPRAEMELRAALHPYDLTSRPQMVTKEMNPSYHFLISEFKNITGSSGILNTSFNLHGEPNVEAPVDALRTFDISGMKYLAIGDFLIQKK